MRLRLSSAFGLAAVLTLGACSGGSSPSARPQDVLVYQDFESLVGWAGVNPPSAPGSLLSTKAAHSGKYAARVSGDVEYGLTFQRPIGELTARRPRKIEFSAWCFLQDAGGRAATIVFEVKSHTDGQKLAWYGFDLSKENPADRTWTKITRVVDIPENVGFSDICMIYPWRGTASSEVLFDDVQLRVLPD